MALDLFRVSAGLNIENDDGTDGPSIITDSGAPGGGGGREDDAAIGTIFLRQDASATISAVYQKITDTNSLADWVQSASKDFVDAAINGLSWREPVLVRDPTAYDDIAAAVTAANIGDTVDGVTIDVDDRLLFTGIADVTLLGGFFNTIAAQDETDFDGAGQNGTFSGGTGHANNDVLTMSDGSTITVDLVAAGVVTEFTVTTPSTSPFATGATLTQTGTTGSGVSFDITTGTANEIADQDETNFDGTGSNGTFSGGTGHAATDVITLSDGSTITVETVAGGVVTEFSVTTGSTSPFQNGATLTQVGTTGSGIDFDITTGSANEVAESPNPNNVYIVSGSTGNWTFTEDTNLATDGDAVLVNDGTSADEQWTYDGDNWIQFGSAANNAELAFIRDFIGKDNPGVETPSYSSAVVVTQNNDLEGAIGELDEAIGDRSYTDENFITNDETITSSLDSLDIQIGDADFTNDNIVTDGETVTSSLDALDSAIGNRTYTEDNFVTDGETITASIDALDQAIGAINALFTTTTTGVTGAAQTIDSVLVDSVEAVKWFIAVFDEGDLDQKFAAEVYATHDGTASGDATFADFNESSKLKINGNITGLDISVTVTGTGAAQVMALQVAAGDTVTVNTTRINVV